MDIFDLKCVTKKLEKEGVLIPENAIPYFKNGERYHIYNFGNEVWISYVIEGEPKTTKEVN